MNNLAAAYQAAGKLDRALPLFEETLALQKAKLGPDHPDTLTSMNNLAVAYQAAGKLDRALPLLEETLALEGEARPRPPRHAHEHEQPRRGLQVAGASSTGRSPSSRRSLRLRVARSGTDHPDTWLASGPTWA